MRVPPPARRRMTWSSRGSSEKCGILLAHSTKVKSCLSAAWQILVTGSLVWGGKRKSTKRITKLTYWGADSSGVGAMFYTNSKKTSRSFSRPSGWHNLRNSSRLLHRAPTCFQGHRAQNTLGYTFIDFVSAFSLHSVYSESGLYVWFIQIGQSCLLSCWGFLRYTSPFWAPRPVQHRESCPQACPRWNCW